MTRRDADESVHPFETTKISSRSPWDSNAATGHMIGHIDGLVEAARCRCAARVQRTSTTCELKPPSSGHIHAFPSTHMIKDPLGGRRMFVRLGNNCMFASVALRSVLSRAGFVVT